MLYCIIWYCIVLHVYMLRAFLRGGLVDMGSGICSRLDMFGVCLGDRCWSQALWWPVPRPALQPSVLLLSGPQNDLEVVCEGPGGEGELRRIGWMCSFQLMLVWTCVSCIQGLRRQVFASRPRDYLTDVGTSGDVCQARPGRALRSTRRPPSRASRPASLPLGHVRACEHLSLSTYMCVCVYIYIYKERERER